MELVSYEVAKSDVEKWLEFRFGKALERRKKKEEFNESVNELIELVQDGTLTINTDTFEITHELCFPYGKDIKVTSLTYKPRVTAQQIEHALKGVDMKTASSLPTAYGSALTGKSKTELGAMDYEDIKIMQKVAVFF